MTEPSHHARETFWPNATQNVRTEDVRMAIPLCAAHEWGRRGENSRPESMDGAGRPLMCLDRCAAHTQILFTPSCFACDSTCHGSASSEIAFQPGAVLQGIFEHHHRFQLVDIPSGRELSRGIEVHTVELSKYNLDESTIRNASSIEQWAFFLLFADRYDAEQLRELLPAIEFQQAIDVIETIAEVTKDKVMYDQRAKAQLDYEWVISSARKEGREEGREEGIIAGKIQLLQQLLGDEELSMEALSRRSLSELSTLQTELQERLRSRDA